jgi:hypothetical protein
MANRQLQGWSADPFGLHEQRYFSAGRPTKLVRDGRVESYDEPPSDTWEAPDEEAEAPESGSEPESVDLPPVTAPGRYAGGRRRSPVLLALAATAIVAATAAGLLVLMRQESPSTPAANSTPAASAVAFVRQSAAQTLAERTADVTLSGAVDNSGEITTISGTGEIDFSTNAMALDMGDDLPGQMNERELLVQGNLYFSITIPGVDLAKLTGGPQWIELPASQSGPANLVGSDPLSSLSLLEQPGIDARSIGTKTIGGVFCTGYAVTPSKAALLASVRAEFAKLGYSPAVMNQEVSLAEGMPPPTITVWLDGQGLLREMIVNVNTQALGPAAGGMVMDVSYYGSPVRITAPPASETETLAAYLKALHREG